MSIDWDYSKIWADPRSAIKRPVEALDLAVQMLNHRSTTPGQLSMERFITGYALSSADKMGKAEIDATLEGRRTVPRNRHAMGDFIKLTEAKALDGMVQYVTPDMMRLLDECMRDMPPEPIFPTDIQFDDGLIVFPRPLLVNWAGKMHKICAIGYASHPEMELVWTNREGMPSETVIGGMALVTYMRPADCCELYELEPNPDGLLFSGPMTMVDCNAWGFGQRWDISPDDQQTSGSQVGTHVATVRRWFLAYCRLMWQEILVPEREHVDKHALKRRMRSLKKTRIDGDVLRVIRMRKVYDERDWFDQTVGQGSSPTHGYYRRPHWRTIHQGTDQERMVRVKGHYVRPDLPIAERWEVVTLER